MTAVNKMPFFLGAIGLLVAAIAILNPELSDDRFESAMAFAGSAVTGAAGLAQNKL